tara:strand:+ start:29 stop:643 length:615 start_codon:yes stop_codon:yes gene_type:complete
MQYNWYINKRKIINSSFNGFTAVEVITSLTLVMVAYLAIMILYAEVMKNFTKSQFIEETRFALSAQIEKIAEDIRYANEVNVIDGFRKRIEITDKNGDQTTYSCINNEGILKNNEQDPEFYGNVMNQLFENNDVYELEVKCEKFDCEKKLTSMQSDSDRLKNNFYTITAEFELTSTIDDEFIKIFKFEQDAMAISSFSRIPNEE